MTEAMTGGCACGKVRFTAQVENDEAYLCHCRMCQRATGSDLDRLQEHEEGGRRAGTASRTGIESSPIARRPYCAACGTSLGFAFPDSEKMDLTVAAFDDPSRFRPKHHFGAESLHRAWLNTEGLPEYRTEDYQPWSTAG